jgi:CheD chemotactic sensory transduction
VDHQALPAANPTGRGVETRACLVKELRRRPREGDNPTRHLRCHNDLASSAAHWRDVSFPASGAPAKHHNRRVNAGIVRGRRHGTVRRCTARERHAAAEIHRENAGGGNMFPDQLTPSGCRDGGRTEARRGACQSVGCRNIGVARALLDAAGFVIASANVGGHGSRQVAFELWSGDLWVRRGAAMTAGAQVAA